MYLEMVCDDIYPAKNPAKGFRARSLKDIAKGIA
jgi:hypothetical protein